MIPKCGLSLIGAALSILAAGCNASSSSEAEQGEEGQPCFPNSTCMEGLSCLSNLCVNAGTDGGAPVDSSDAAESSVSTVDGGAKDATPIGDSGAEAEGAPPPGPDASPPVDVDEPNGNKTWTEDKTIATPLPLGEAHKAWISFKGDEDFYKVSITKSGTLRITLTTAEATPVDLASQLFCPAHNSWGSVVQPDGSLGPTSISKNIKVDASITKTYYLLVHDDEDDDVDPMKPYTVTVTML